MIECTRCKTIAENLTSKDDELCLDELGEVSPVDEFNGNWQEIALDLKELINGQGAMTAKTSEHARDLLLGMNEKLKVLEIVQLKAVDCYAKGLGHLKAREGMHAAFEENLECIDSKFKTTEGKLEKVMMERNSFKAQLDDVTERLRLKECEEDRLKSQVKICLLYTSPSPRDS